MKALVLSGGASKGAFTAGVIRYLLRDKQMSFDLAIGTSTGALAGGPALLGEYNYMGNIYAGVEDSDIYKNGPFFKLLNLFKKVGPVSASMKPLHETVRQYYLDWGKLQKLIDMNKEFVVTIVNVRTGKIEYVSSKQVKAKGKKKISPETFVNAIVASCSEPVFTRPIRVFGKEPNSPMRKDLFYDGGVKEFLPFEHAVKLGAKEIWAVSTHPLKTEETKWGGTTRPDKVNLLKALGWTVGTLLDEVERGDLFRACFYFRRNWLKERIAAIAGDLALTPQNTRRLLKACDGMFPGGKEDLQKLRVIAPSKPMPTSLEFDPKIMAKYLAKGILTAKKFIKQGAPTFDQCVKLLMP